LLEKRKVAIVVLRLGDNMEAITDTTARENLIFLIDKVLADYHAEVDNKCSCSGKCDNSKCSSEAVESNSLFV
jgi:hypothetical protein